MGDSVLVAGDAGAVKVHAHSNRPDEILAYGLTHGTLSRISVENLDAQAIEVREERARAFTEAAAGPRESPAVAASGRIAAPAAAGATAARAPLAVVAVASGDGLVAIFQSCGCTRIVSGGNGTNPSTGELLAAVDEVNANHVLLLPNNPNILLAARQVADLRGGAVTVVPSRNAAEGLAALLALDPASSAAVNADAMSRAARSIQSLQVTQAVRDAEIGNRTVTKGQVIVLNPDDGLVAVDGDEARAVIAGIGALNPGYELLTIYYGDGADLAAAEALGRQITEQRPGVEVEIVRGGQPHYRYLIAAE
jgi:dihydroxyacetone kinase-like predicted kinase